MVIPDGRHPSSSTSAPGIPSARVYLGLVSRFFGREARAAGESNIMSVMATRGGRIRPPPESALPWPFASVVGRKCSMPSVLGLGQVWTARIRHCPR